MVFNATFNNVSVISWTSLIYFRFSIKFGAFINVHRGRRGRDRMVVGFTTTCAISAYHH
jgi:hypothetical protein